MELTIVRSPKLLDIFRNYSVYLNGVKAGKLPIHTPLHLNSEKELKNISFKIDWVQSKEIDLTSFGKDESIKVKVGINKWFIYSTLVGLAFILLGYVADIEVFRYLMLFPFMIDLYFLSIGRKDYFKIDVLKAK